MQNVMMSWIKTEQNGGRVEPITDGWRLHLSSDAKGYANAQLDDYQWRRAQRFRWQRGARLVVRARFSHAESDLVGTAGFGLWNAPFGPGTGSRPRLPQAVWFFYASAASDLPLAPVDEQGNGWFASTIDASTPQALRWAPLVVPVILLNQFAALRRILWPLIRRDLGISFQRLNMDLRSWHQYELWWRTEHTIFTVDGRPVLTTPRSPRGPLGIVTWIDNQAMVAKPTGKLSWRTEGVPSAQALDIVALSLESVND